MPTNRAIKDDLYKQVARIAKAVASEKRLELIELLCQAPKSVEMLAAEASISVKLASAHLKALRVARLLETERRGKHVIYRIASAQVPRLWVMLHTLAEDRLVELQGVLKQLAAAHGEWRGEDRAELLRKAKAGDIVMIDVRPPNEFAQAHLPYARSMPLADLRTRLAELPMDKPIVAYCRGPFCLMSDDAVRLLREQGFSALKLREGVAEWAMVPAGA
nr:metalloregulator ArsR/SmtB family transcription factor [uncultured Cupriavidus sp.]